MIAMTRAGIKVLPSIINAAIFTSAFSAGNSFLFSSSRVLYGLALRGQAPRVFTYCTKAGLPILAVLFTVSFGHRYHLLLLSCTNPFQSAFAFLAFMNVQASSEQVFKYVLFRVSLTLLSLTGHIAGSSTCQQWEASSLGGP